MRFCNVKSLKQIHSKFQNFVDFFRCFQTFRNNLHVTFMRIRNNIFHDLLLIRIRINVTNDRKIVPTAASPKTRSCATPSRAWA